MMADARIRLRDLAAPEVALATGFGSGLVPYAPGTFGSLAALAVWWWLLADLPIAMQLGVVAVVAAASVWIIDRTCAKVGVGDAGAIVLDEWVGLWIALLPAPHTWLGALLGFALFRLFDIAKPWPVSWADRNLHGGLGILLDDVIAGVLAGIVVWLAVVGSTAAGFAWVGV